jgi:hypothetical protein
MKVYELQKWLGNHDPNKEVLITDLENRIKFGVAGVHLSLQHKVLIEADTYLPTPPVDKTLPFFEGLKLDTPTAPVDDPKLNMKPIPPLLNKLLKDLFGFLSLY